jgi:hypothetical protein
MLEILFNKVLEIGYNVQVAENNGRKIDGRMIWGSIENIFKSINIKMFNFEYKLNNKLYKDIQSLNIKDEFNPKVNHFLMQLYNLVEIKSDKRIIELYRLFQIAYNLGQLKYNYDKKSITKEMKKVIDNNLEVEDIYLFSIHKFVNIVDINNIDRVLEKEQMNFIVLLENIHLDIDKQLYNTYKGGYIKYELRKYY